MKGGPDAQKPSPDLRGELHQIVDAACDRHSDVNGLRNELWRKVNRLIAERTGEGVAEESREAWLIPGTPITANVERVRGKNVYRLYFP